MLDELDVATQKKEPTKKNHAAEAKGKVEEQS